ncbi:hypothetical protein M409DRAFT_17868 [Zasmidium cellare ATCC 36951]|uniref:Ketoreductase domain-containing protein n=1 Tax=Zasmidium cellare ATCC 36951 TaxID=1080233 RepID=A0A6A6D0F0_ZASCE|nr:uncharacterized protein M409DRAFT_17868 [Zasmidium cellare ATCC 36951]KAF2171632.1 hypothetical protein M409DRAFT_17868 [Zasmidium cellare ATCC 36951]
MDPTPLKGKNTIVTGGSRGIGQAIALELAKRGANILITYNASATGANKTLSLIASQTPSAKAHAIQANCRTAQPTAEKILREAQNFFPDGGGIDIIVNNAADGEMTPLDALDTEAFDRIMHTNVLLPLLLYKVCRPHLRRGVRIVNVSSIAARTAVPFNYAYGASKAALESITRSMAMELGRSLEGTANAVNPGPVSTDMWNTAKGLDIPAAEKQIAAMTLAGDRIGYVDDIFPIVAFLCDPSAKWVTGNVTCANGGLCML